MRSATLALAFVLAALGPGPALASPASPLLAPDHWAVQAADRAEASGLLPRWMPAQRAVPVLTVAAALAEAEEAALRERPDLVPLVSAWRQRLAAEWRGAGSPGAVIGAQVSGGYAASSIRVPQSALPAGPGALRLDGAPDDPFLEARGGVAYGAHLGAGADVRATPWAMRLATVEGVAAAGPLALSVGRAPVGYGPGQVGGVVFTGTAPLDRLEAMTTEPLRFPGLLGYLGDFALDGFLARLDEARHPYHPLLSGVQVQWRPFQRLTLGVARGVMLGGTVWAGVPPKKVPTILLGIDNYRENNVASLSARLRLPTEAFLPLTARVEWGTDDNGGALFQAPAIIAGLSTPFIPGTTAAVGFEYAYLGRICCRDQLSWYTHGQYTGGWATGQTALGDPLGGDGHALRLTAAAEPWEARVRLGGLVFVQDRFAENLYAPSAAGRSAGFRAEAELRFIRGALGARGGYERAAHWSQGQGTLEASWYY